MGFLGLTVIVNILAGRYEITQTLGGGGFAITFLARDILQPSKPLCVVKQLRPNQSHPRVVEFFETEAAILERLGKHPQIPQLLAHFWVFALWLSWWREDSFSVISYQLSVNDEQFSL